MEGSQEDSIESLGQWSQRGIEAIPHSEQAFGESGKELLTLNNRNLSRFRLVTYFVPTMIANNA